MLDFIQFSPKVMALCIDLLSGDTIYISASLSRWFVYRKALMFLETTLIIDVAISFTWLLRLKITRISELPKRSEISVLAKVPSSVWAVPTLN